MIASGRPPPLDRSKTKNNDVDRQNLEPKTEAGYKPPLARLLAPFTEIFGLSRGAALVAFLSVVFVMGFAGFWFVHSAPPHMLTITSGPPGSMFETNAFRYRDILGSNGVTLKVLPSQGSQENLQRLNNPSFKVDVGFVQGGMTNGFESSKLVSLGSVSYQPMLIFYRGDASVGVLSELAGKRLAIGPLGSGTRALALTLLALNGIETNSATPLLDLEPAEAATALTNGTVDAVFLMGDSASRQVMRQLLRDPQIHLLSFSQADGYTRRVSYLNKLALPRGGIDFGKKIPAEDVYLIGPTVEILARPNLHPALSDLLLEAAREVNGVPGLLQRKDEFPAPIKQQFLISKAATRFYKSGKGLLYGSLPFWLATLVNQILVAFVPAVLVLIPGLRLIPALFKWRTRMKIYRRYRALLIVEGELQKELPPGKREELIGRLDEIEASVSQMKVPASFADQFYALRGHIGFVRQRLMACAPQR